MEKTIYPICKLHRTSELTEGSVYDVYSVDNNIIYN